MRHQARGASGDEVHDDADAKGPDAVAGGVFFAKLINLFLPKDKKINPMIGAAGISAFPMSGRVVNQMGLKEDNQNFLLMQSISVNVSGQIGSVIAGGLILTLVQSILAK